MTMDIDRKKIYIAAAVVAAVAALAWAFAPNPVAVETAVAERARFEQAIEEDGRTRLKDRSYTISAPVTARLARTSLHEGDKVTVGDAVAVLTPVVSPMNDERTSLEAQARLKGAEAGVALAAARVERARVSLEQAKLELQRTEKLANQGFMSPSTLDNTRLALDAANHELETAQAQRRVAAQEREQAAAALVPATGSRGGQLVVRSPAAGVVLKVQVPSEATVVAGTPLLEVGDPARMEVIAQLLTTDAVQALPGTRASIERWGGPPVEGHVRLVEPAAFTKVSALGVEEQRVNVVIDVGDPPKSWAMMGDAFRVTARLITMSVDGATVVPVGAVFPHGDGGMAVYVLDGGRARLTPVELGGRNAEVAWVRSGVTVGQPVIVYPSPSVADGKRVRVRKL
jgi:HlyD family secretion protein